MKKMKKTIKLIITLLIFNLNYSQQYDLVVKNGFLIDAKNNINKTMDIAIKEGKIASVERKIDASLAKKVIDAKGLVVTPGLIDIHTHNFYGTKPNSAYSNGFNSLPPDGFTFRAGVTTVVDCGGAGWRNFITFKEQVIDRSKTRVLALINIVGRGMSGNPNEQDISDMDPKLTSMMADQFKEHIVGVKLAHFLGYNWEPTELAVEAGEISKIPVVIDFGASDPVLPLNTLLNEKLRPGDIYTHCYSDVKGRTAILDENGKVRDYVFEAQKRGVVMDVGHGAGSFYFHQAIPAVRQGLKPNSISTDLHIFSMNGGAKNMTNVMSKFLNMDMTLEEVIEASTWKPAQYIQRTELGHLSEGAIADLSILKIHQGNFGFLDVLFKRMKGDKKIVCELTLKDGEVVYDLNGIASQDWDKQYQ